MVKGLLGKFSAASFVSNGNGASPPVTLIFHNFSIWVELGKKIKHIPAGASDWQVLCLVSLNVCVDRI